VRLVIFFIKQEVFRLDIPVADFTVVKVAQSVESLSHDEGSLRFSKMLSLSDVVE